MPNAHWFGTVLSGNPLGAILSGNPLGAVHVKTALFLGTGLFLLGTGLFLGAVFGWGASTRYTPVGLAIFFL